ncbi:DUF1842 domain-containing protein [Massilia sp. R2A-15]|uniref:DUF1842 domain-containing protein n=1 Tax=Massilia sp. R2A-15 TaxID=3064278 RepID=UPI002736C881|nr:DUF1842 domain-containing protein [Massilia sp. R2A-15]WLI91056.1 DUF1842 domain-containing protein [Massilia sp. R2A-15]
MSDSEFIDADPIYLMCGNLGMPGAPILSLALMYDTGSGMISGQGMITQSVAPPNGRIAIHAISGEVHGLGLGGVTRVMTLTGTFQGTPPTAPVTERFTAIITTDERWQGHGTFTYGGNTVRNVPVKQRG